MQKIPVTRFLVIFFSTILILLTISVFLEYKKFKHAQATVNELIHKSLRRQQILTSIQKASVYTRVNVLTDLLYRENRTASNNLVRQKIVRNDQYYLDYQNLIVDEYEQQLFDSVQVFRSLNNRIWQRINETNYKIDEKELSDLFEDFQYANISLAEYVKQRDALMIEEANLKFSEIEKLNQVTGTALIVLLVIMGIIIGRTVKVMSNKNSILAINERKYWMFSEQTSEIIEKCDANDKIIYANEPFKKTFEYTDEELANLSLNDILADPSQNLNKPLPGFEDVIMNVHKVFISKSGKKIYLEGNILLEYKNKKFIGSIGFFNDVTEKKQLEESLVASEVKFRNLFNMAPNPMWVIDSETYRFLLVNNAAIKHYGFSKEEFASKTIFDISPKEDIPEIKESISRWMHEISEHAKQSKVYTGHSRHMKKPNEIIEVEIYYTPLILNDKTDILSISIDVTERNQSEHKITRAIIKAQEDERYEIGGELHDNVCQILAAAKMSLGMLKRSLDPSAIGLFNQSQHSIKLATEEIRNLSHRLAPAFFNNTSLEEAFKSLVKTFYLDDTSHISMYIDNKIKTYPVNRDVQLNLYRILQEQLRNIIKYANGTLVEIDVLVHNDKLKMRIADNGVGFNVSEVKRGIGLSNMKRRAELFGGKIKIESSPGKGCEVLVTIPIKEIY
ncbi:MAG: PAS domain-containing sensor histidine kinase [Ginsengibacter sp.]